MSTVVAISITDRSATLVTGRIQEKQESTDGGFDLLHVTSVPFPDAVQSDPASSDAAAENAAPNEVSAEGSFVIGENSNVLFAIEESIGEEIDSIVAMLSTGSVLYKRIVLPFNDQKNINKVAHHQLQDTIPFDIHDFVIDNQVLGEAAGSGYEILASLAPTKDIRTSLERVERFGADPKVVTSKASALCGIASLLETGGAAFGVLEFSQARCALALFHKHKLVLLRELDAEYVAEPAADGSDAGRPAVSESVLANIRCSLGTFERLRGTVLEKLYVIAPTDVARACADALPVAIEPVQIGNYVRNRTADKVSVEQISWAVGLFAAEQLNGTSVAPLVDFRRGQFTYRKSWSGFWEAFRHEAFYIVAAAVLAVAWLGMGFYMTNRQLTLVENEITTAVRSSGITDSVPKRRELETMEEKVTELEDKLRAVGSLSSLSPLESLKELSEVIGRDIDIEIEGMNIGSARLFFRGSLPDNPALGRLEGVLNKRKEFFCKVQVEPKGRAGARVNFTADIELCE